MFTLERNWAQIGPIQWANRKESNVSALLNVPGAICYRRVSSAEALTHFRNKSRTCSCAQLVTRLTTGFKSWDGRYGRYGPYGRYRPISSTASSCENISAQKPARMIDPLHQTASNVLWLPIADANDCHGAAGWERGRGVQTGKWMKWMKRIRLLWFGAPTDERLSAAIATVSLESVGENRSGRKFQHVAEPPHAFDESIPAEKHLSRANFQ